MALPVYANLGDTYEFIYFVMWFIMLQVYSLEDGPARGAWRSLGVPVTIIQICDQPEIVVDWLKYEFSC